MRANTLQVNEMQGSSGAKQIARSYNMTVNIYAASALIIVQKNCFSFQFTNIGDTIARVNGMVIFPSATPLTALGDSRSISGHQLDLYKGNITLEIDNPAGVIPAIEIVQLFYSEAYDN